MEVDIKVQAQNSCRISSELSPDWECPAAHFWGIFSTSALERIIQMTGEKGRTAVLCARQVY